MPAKKQKRYVVAMSGGVDSSVAAALMVEAGHEVIGITLQLTPMARRHKVGSCCAGADIDDARTVAQQLNIPHYVLNFEKQFTQHVMQDFINSYMDGKTPVPCVRCNQKVKFQDLLTISQNLRAEKLVTGHYARITKNRLHRAHDKTRDQSYFLFATTPEQLAHLHFPLGEMTKDEVRRHAARFNLPNADKAESRDLCFVSEGHYTDVIRRLHPNANRKGDIYHKDGSWLGVHDGIEQFTIGQRRGLNIGGKHSNQQDKLYVIAIQHKKNNIIVGPKDALARQTITVRDLHWLNAPKNNDSLLVQWRSPQEPLAARITHMGSDSAAITLNQHNFGIAAGQACVFYQHSQLLGGGWIADTPS